jgi:hypothetical protein
MPRKQTRVMDQRMQLFGDWLSSFFHIGPSNVGFLSIELVRENADNSCEFSPPLQDCTLSLAERAYHQNSSFVSCFFSGPPET